MNKKIMTHITTIPHSQGIETTRKREKSFHHLIPIVEFGCILLYDETHTKKCDI